MVKLRKFATRLGAVLGAGGFALGYYWNQLGLGPIDCTPMAYGAACASLADKLLYMAGNVGSTLTGFAFAIPGAALYTVASHTKQPPAD